MPATRAVEKSSGSAHHIQLRSETLHVTHKDTVPNSAFALTADSPHVGNKGHLQPADGGRCKQPTCFSPSQSPVGHSQIETTVGGQAED